MNLNGDNFTTLPFTCSSYTSRSLDPNRDRQLSYYQKFSSPVKATAKHYWAAAGHKDSGDNIRCVCCSLLCACWNTTWAPSQNHSSCFVQQNHVVRRSACQGGACSSEGPQLQLEIEDHHRGVLLSQPYFISSAFTSNISRLATLLSLLLSCLAK